MVPNRPRGTPGLCVCPEAPPQRHAAAALAERLGLELRPDLDGWQGLALVVTAERLELRFCAPGAPGPLAVDFGSLQRPGRDLLGRAIGAGHPRGADPVAIDATAGFGGDTLALAARGYRVFAIERSAPVAALLADGLDRAAREGSEIVRRIELHAGDARTLISQLPAADLLLLDPMFPTRDRSALPAKQLRALRALAGDDDDAAELLGVARSAALRRVIVKRPRRGPLLPGPPPSGSVSGTTIRYDIYPPLAGG